MDVFFMVMVCLNVAIISSFLSGEVSFHRAHLSAFKEGIVQGLQESNIWERISWILTLAGLGCLTAAVTESPRLEGLGLTPMDGAGVFLGACCCLVFPFLVGWAQIGEEEEEIEEEGEIQEGEG